MTTVVGRRFKRPIAVTLAGTIASVVAGFHIYHSVYQIIKLNIFSGGKLINSIYWTPQLVQYAWRFGFEFSLALLAIVIILNFYRLRPWSWVALVVWVTVNILVDLLTYFYASMNYISMIVNVIVAFSILQNDVQVIFGIRKPEEKHELSY